MLTISAPLHVEDPNVMLRTFTKDFSLWVGCLTIQAVTTVKIVIYHSGNTSLRKWKYLSNKAKEKKGKK